MEVRWYNDITDRDLPPDEDPRLRYRCTVPGCDPNWKVFTGSSKWGNISAIAKHAESKAHLRSLKYLRQSDGSMEVDNEEEVPSGRDEGVPSDSMHGGVVTEGGANHAAGGGDGDGEGGVANGVSSRGGDGGGGGALGVPLGGDAPVVISPEVLVSGSSTSEGELQRLNAVGGGSGGGSGIEDGGASGEGGGSAIRCGGVGGTVDPGYIYYCDCSTLPRLECDFQHDYYVCKNSECDVKISKGTDPHAIRLPSGVVCPLDPTRETT